MFRRTAEKIICRNDLSRSKWQFCCAPFCMNATQTVETVTKKTHVGEIQVPKKKKRDPFQVLSALSSVVGQDPTRSLYLIEDDMFMKPRFKMQFEQYLSAKASGRKAAKTLINMKPELFETPVINTAESPSIKAFTPRKFWFKNNEPSEDALLERIHSKDYQEVITMYSMVKEEGISLSQETLQLLLDFVGFYEGKKELVNSKNRELEENFLQLKPFMYDRTTPVWHADNLPTQIFESLPEKTPEAYNSMFRALLEHKDTPHLQAIYNEMKSLNIPYERSTYHVLLQRMNDMPRESKISGSVLNVLKQMSKAGMEPTEETFNCAIHGCLRPLNKVRQTDLELALGIIDEMKMFGIEPTMKTWFLLAKVIQAYPVFQAHKNLQHKMIDYMQGKEYSIYYERNYTFFTFLMNTAFKLTDISLAMKTIQLLDHGRNRLNLAQATHIYYFYSNFLSLLIESQSVETALEWVHKLIPSKIESLSGRIIQDFFTAISDQEAYQYIPQVLKVSKGANMLAFSSNILTIMNEKVQEPELQNTFADFAAELAEKWITYKEADSEETFRSQRVVLTSDDVCNIMTLLHKSDRKEESWNFFKVVEVHRTGIQGIFSEGPFQILLDDIIEKEMTENAVEMLKFMSLEAFSGTANAAKKVLSKLTLTDMERQHVETFATTSKEPKYFKKKNRPDRTQRSLSH